MARPFALAGVFVWILILLMPSSSMCLDLQAKIDQGRELHLEILERHRKIDKFYHEPSVNGVLTDKPLLCISVPETDWESLPESKKDDLAAYVASLLINLKSDPFIYYNGVDANAPAARIARRNIKTMSSESWGIMVGKISPDGRDIMSDRIVRSGK